MSSFFFADFKKLLCISSLIDVTFAAVISINKITT